MRHSNSATWRTMRFLQVGAVCAAIDVLILLTMLFTRYALLLEAAMWRNLVSLPRPSSKV